MFVLHFFLPSSVEKHCGCLATFHWINCFCDPWNVRGNASFSLAVPRVWRPRPLSSASEHTRTQTGTHKDTRGRIWTRRQTPACACAHARLPDVCKGKAIRHRRGTSRPFYSFDIPSPRRDITTIRDPFSCVIITTRLTNPHSDKKINILYLHYFFVVFSFIGFGFM